MSSFRIDCKILVLKVEALTQKLPKDRCFHGADWVLCYNLGIVHSPLREASYGNNSKKSVHIP